MAFPKRSMMVSFIILLSLISGACAELKVSASTGDATGAASISGKYRLQDSAFLDSDITLGRGVVSRRSSAGGSGKNAISEGVLGSSASITNTVNSDGSFSSISSDSASGAGAASAYQTSLAGSSGSTYTISNGQENEMVVAGAFSGQGNMDVSLSSLAAQEALITGKASALGTPCFSDELAQGIRGQDAAVSVQGLYLAGDQGLGEFGMVVQNTKSGGAAPKPQPTTAGYKLKGYMWPSSIPIVLSSIDLPEGYDDASEVGAQISAAEGIWDGHSGKTLFSTLGTISDSTTFNRDLAKWDVTDNKNVHLWTSDTGLGSNTIAMTVTWYKTPKKTVLGADRNRYFEAVESDCWYNNGLDWRIDTDENVGQKIANTYDIRTIALHELGHTLGLADLYSTADNAQTMYGYNDGTSDWTLNSGDIAGLQKLYGR